MSKPRCLHYHRHITAHRGLPLFGRLIGILATITDVFFGIKSSSLYSGHIHGKLQCITIAETERNTGIQY